MLRSSKAQHQWMRRTLGLASSYPCIVCLRDARDWAYQHSDPEELYDPVSGEPYSLDPSHYRPMCRQCHKILDHGGDPREAMVKRSMPKERRTLPHQEAVEMGRKGGTRRSERMKEDPALRARLVESALKNLPREKRVCLECGLETTTPGMGNHLKSSGHSGYRKG